MTRAMARRLSRAMVVADLILLAVAATTLAATPSLRSKGSEWIFMAVATTVSIVYAVVGSLIVSSNPRNTIGWIFASMALAAALWGASIDGSIYVLTRDPGSGFGLGIAWASNLWSAGVLPIGFVFLLFPDGRAPSRAWRRLGWALGISGAVSVLAFALTPDPDLNNLLDAGIRVANPIAIGDRSTMSATAGAGGTAALILSALTVFAIRGRFKRGTLEERQQIRWLAAVGTTAGFLLLLMVFLAFFPPTSSGSAPIIPILLVLFALTLAFGIPAASAVAILKYRLFDLDVVIKKTAIALVITLLLALVGLALVWIFGQPALWGETPRSLTIAIGIAIGILVVPILRLSRRLARRIVFGKRAAPYDVLARFSGQVGEAYDTEDVLARMAALLGEATGAEGALVWVRVGTEFLPEGVWPSTAVPPNPVAAPPDGLPQFGASAAREVLDRGELLGALTLEMAASDPMSLAKERLIADLASQAGLVLRNVKLIEELRASRQRLVAAQDEERRKIERNLHDGAQQQLVALSVKLKLLGQLAVRDPEKVTALADQLQLEATGALEDLRDLARGIYPPLLADKGLVAALESQARKSPVPVTIRADEVGRFRQDAEAAVYFCCLEALQNVSKYAKASQATVSLTNGAGTLTFEVVDDGEGFDSAQIGYGTGLQGMADRLAALGGTLEVRSRPGGGTTIRGGIPVLARP
jgi:signal transduction histidine kinase